MLGFLSQWRRCWEENAALVEGDAQTLVAQFGDAAYGVARERVREEGRGRTIDAGRPDGHWTKVKLRIAELNGRDGMVDTATRMAERGDA